MSTFEIGFLVVFALISIGFSTGGSNRRRRQAEERRMEDEKQRDAKIREAHEEYLNEKRRELIRLREFHLSEIRSKNERFLKENGAYWTDEKAEMLEYDRLRRRDWESVGMVPPSFAK